jgi:uncharacterized membrane protein YgaE (UPF0421/DUF939 family)
MNLPLKYLKGDPLYKIMVGHCSTTTLLKQKKVLNIVRFLLLPIHSSLSWTGFERCSFGICTLLSTLIYLYSILTVRSEEKQVFIKFRNLNEFSCRTEKIISFILQTTYLHIILTIF